MSQSAVTGMTPLLAQPANLGPAAALISRWLFFLPMEVVWRPPMMDTRCAIAAFTSSGYDETTTLYHTLGSHRGLICDHAVVIAYDAHYLQNTSR